MIRLTIFYLMILWLLGFSCFAVAGKSPRENGPSNEESRTETVQAFYKMLSGDWTGSYSLWLRPGTPARISEINAQIRSLAKGNYFLMTYDWMEDNKTQEGVFLFGGHKKKATATWGDSFHMTPEPMQCKGELKDEGRKLIFNGSYAVGEGPDWGWRTEFTILGADAFLMEAYNIMPNGVEGLAVKAELKRTTEKDK